MTNPPIQPGTGETHHSYRSRKEVIGIKLFAWNGIQLQIPADWEPRFPEKKHIVFEKDFKPQLQLRWEELSKPNPKKLKEKLAQLSSTSKLLNTNAIPLQWSPLKEKFGLLLAAADAGSITSGLFGCSQCKTMFFFQVLEKKPRTINDSAISLTSIICHDQKDILWQFQDYSFNTPFQFTLNSYSFAAGLARLSFKGPNHLLCHTCRLGPAKLRLEQQSLREILETLVGDTKEVSVVMQEEHLFCILERKPSIGKQITYRLKRQQPFIKAHIWHDAPNNHLFAVVLLSKYPISIDSNVFYSLSQ